MRGSDWSPPSTRRHSDGAVAVSSAANTAAAQAQKQDQGGEGHNLPPPAATLP
eukprot:COSAG01_NODE_25279_length_750_cov_0.947773_1_plen_52_part_01